MIINSINIKSMKSMKHSDYHGKLLRLAMFFVALFLCGTMALTMLAGCGSSQEQGSEKSKNAANDQSSSSDISGELNIVHFLSEPQKVAALDEMVAGFEEEYPNVKVNQESTTLENYQDVLKLKFSTGDVPDVVFGAPKTYSTFVESGNIEDITDESYVSRVQENTLQNVKIDGKVYGIPLDVMANAVLYNKDICKCSSCGGKIIPLPTEQHFIKPKPHMLC